MTRTAGRFGVAEGRMGVALRWLDGPQATALPHATRTPSAAPLPADCGDQLSHPGHDPKLAHCRGGDGVGAD